MHTGADTDNLPSESPKPSTDQLKAEIGREITKDNWNRLTRRVAGTLLVAAAVAGLLVMLLFPVLKINGNSLSGNLRDGDFAVAFNAQGYSQGDVIAFFHGNDILIRRVIATAGQKVSIDESGTVTVDGIVLSEPYADPKVPGESDVQYPVLVPEGSVFVLSDKRDNVSDSRNSIIGCIKKDDIIGRLFVRIWPIKDLKLVE